MTILFLGEEGAYESAAESGTCEAGSPIFFAPSLPEPGSGSYEELDAVVIPAQRFLTLAPLHLPVPVMTSGPPSLLAECLAAGCADFLREPWSIDELEARLLRFTGSNAGWLEDGGKWNGKVLSGPGGQQTLSPGLAALLGLLLANYGTFVPKAAIAAVLGSAGNHSRAIDMQVSRLRSIFIRLELPVAAQALQSDAGGYRYSLPCK